MYPRGSGQLRHVVREGRRRAHARPERHDAARYRRAHRRQHRVRRPRSHGDDVRPGPGGARRTRSTCRFPPAASARSRFVAARARAPTSPRSSKRSSTAARRTAGNADLTIPRRAQHHVRLEHAVHGQAGRTCTTCSTRRRARTTSTPAAQAFSADFRPTLISHQPITFETGASSQPMSVGDREHHVVHEDVRGTCTVIALQNADRSIAGQACINNRRCDRMRADRTSSSRCCRPRTRRCRATRRSRSTAAGRFIGVWTTSGTPGPLSGATITVEDVADAKIVYGDLGTTAFQPNATATRRRRAA